MFEISLMELAFIDVCMHIFYSCTFLMHLYIYKKVDVNSSFAERVCIEKSTNKCTFIYVYNIYVLPTPIYSNRDIVASDLCALLHPEFPYLFIKRERERKIGNGKKQYFPKSIYIDICIPTMFM